MKLAAIYNAWDGVELLRGSINCIKGHVDIIIIVYQKTSNWGEQYDPLPDMNLPTCNYLLVEYFPLPNAGFENEKRKRNLGLDVARAHNCTHFLHLDCDEYYHNFDSAKALYYTSGARGSVCKLFTYFKKPTLRCDFEDGYYVPFIHELRSDSIAGCKQYPFHVDPTRRINEDNVVLINVYMHHFSYVRKNIERKINNSSARNNIFNGKIMEDYYSDKVAPGFYVRDWDRKLVFVENHFGISIN